MGQRVMTSQPAINLRENTTTQTPAVTQLTVTGMTCGNCARHVTEALQSVSGVRSAMVSLDARTASVSWAPSATPDLSRLIRAVEEAGYGAKVLEVRQKQGAESKLVGWQLNLWIGVLGTLPLMAGEWIFRRGMS